MREATHSTPRAPAPDPPATVPAKDEDQQTDPVTAELTKKLMARVTNVHGGWGRRKLDFTSSCDKAEGHRNTKGTAMLLDLQDIIKMCDCKSEQLYSFIVAFRVNNSTVPFCELQDAAGVAEYIFAKIKEGCRLQGKLAALRK